MPDDHSKLVPLLPIPNRTVKRLCADDSAGSRVKVGHRQALTAQKTPVIFDWGFLLWASQNASSAADCSMRSGSTARLAHLRLLAPTRRAQRLTSLAGLDQH